MLDLLVKTVSDATTRRDWRQVHNDIIRAGPLSVEQVQGRADKHLLEVGYLDDVPVSCTTVRQPSGERRRVVVIVRVLPLYRRRGIGQTLLDRAEGQAQQLGAGRIETIVWAANVDGLRFAITHGYTEVDRYLPRGQDIPYITLRRNDAAP
ncbi:GNAT family N-acetyltransferase [Micromonospora chokoriensis]